MIRVHLNGPASRQETDYENNNSQNDKKVKNTAKSLARNKTQ
jgi:hypothetical protein